MTQDLTGCPRPDLLLDSPSEVGRQHYPTARAVTIWGPVVLWLRQCVGGAGDASEDRGHSTGEAAPCSSNLSDRSVGICSQRWATLALDALQPGSAGSSTHCGSLAPGHLGTPPTRHGIGRHSVPWWVSRDRFSSQHWASWLPGVGSWRRQGSSQEPGATQGADMRCWVSARVPVWVQ